ncbi:hypothetical protein M5K25_012555 [Dendrobium thyrsiflorum]|uniref:Non-haem dioxygenase N-terminal domain-containing protein n=1 Tax=Dendrobium thyrsiflorum TaxID=117978 RepID=A0ABD0UXT4_DENTH
MFAFRMRFAFPAHFAFLTRIGSQTRFVFRGFACSLLPDEPLDDYFFPTESVQEIVRKNPEAVPERYVRNKEDEGGDDLLPHLFLDIPVIDLFLLASGDEEELKKLDMACRDWGFFQIINHDIPIVSYL